MKRSLPFLLATLLVIPLLASRANADSFGAIVIDGPIPNPFPATDPLANASIPGGGVTAADVGMTEEEFFYSGEVDVYTYVDGNVHIGQKVIKAVDVLYKTRMIVRRPPNAADFNGTVVIESMNSTASFDSTPAWLPSAEYFAREGIVYIGVTTSGNQAIPFLTGGCGGLNPPCGSRYASLGMSDNGQEYEMVNQLATALKTNGGPLPGAFGPVERVFMTGQSQQGGSVITHAGEFHFANLDGYFFMGASSARAISSGAPRLQGDERRVPTDLPVPVYRGSSEGDVGSGSTRQKDRDTSKFASFRLIEVPGTSHNPIHKVEIFPFVPLSFFCVNTPFSLADGPVFGSYVWNAMWENMRIQVDEGIKPPKAPRITIKKGVIQRDMFENAKGGVRLPEMDVPTASYFSPNNQGKPLCSDTGGFPPGCIPSFPPIPDFFLRFIAQLACITVGSQEPFDQPMLTNLYGEPDSYRDMVDERAIELMEDRFLLKEDFQKLLDTADEVDFPEAE